MNNSLHARRAPAASQPVAVVKALRTAVTVRGKVDANRAIVGVKVGPQAASPLHESMRKSLKRPWPPRLKSKLLHNPVPQHLQLRPVETKRTVRPSARPTNGPVSNPAVAVAVQTWLRMHKVKPRVQTAQLK